MKKLFLPLIALAIIYSCEKSSEVDVIAEEGLIGVSLRLDKGFAVSSSDSSVDSSWPHIFQDLVDITFSSTTSSYSKTVSFNPNDVSSFPNTSLPYDTYNWSIANTGGSVVVSSALYIYGTSSSAFTVGSASTTIPLTLSTDFALVTVSETNLSSVSISQGGTDTSLTTNNGFYYGYINSVFSDYTVTFTSVEDQSASDTITTPSASTHYNYTISYEGGTSVTVALSDTFQLEERGVTIGLEAIYLAENGVTIKARDFAQIGAIYELNGFTYQVVDEIMLRQMVADNDDITKVVTTKITDMSFLFDGNNTFNQDISSWDVSNVIDMGGMFRNSIFNGDISSWDVSNVKFMNVVFQDNGFINQDLSLWCVLNVQQNSDFDTNSGLTKNQLPIWGTCPKDSLLLYLPLNGDVNDYSGNNVAMASNGVELTTDRFGYAESAYLIDNAATSGSGAGDLIWSDEKFMENSEENYSFSFWVNYSNNTQQHSTFSLIGTSGGIGTTYNMNPSPNKIAHWRSTHLNSTGWDVLANSQFNGSVSPNTWLHITVTKSGEVYKYYLNGVLDRTINVDPNISYETGTVRIRIGNNTYDYNNGSWVSFIEQMKGKVDDVFVWNRTLSDTEISKHFEKR